MVDEAKLHQFIGHLFARTPSGEPIRPTVLGALGRCRYPRSHAPAKKVPKKLRRQGAANASALAECRAQSRFGRLRIKWRIMKIAVAIGMVVWLAFANTAYAVCLPNVLPQFAVAVQANAFMQNDCEPIQFQLSALGPGLAGNADATGTAAL